MPARTTLQPSLRPLFPMPPHIRDGIQREQRRRLAHLAADREFFEALRTADPRARDSRQVRAMLLAMRHLEIGPAYIANSGFDF